MFSSSWAILILYWGRLSITVGSIWTSLLKSDWKWAFSISGHYRRRFLLQLHFYFENLMGGSFGGDSGNLPLIWRPLTRPLWVRLESQLFCIGLRKRIASVVWLLFFGGGVLFWSLLDGFDFLLMAVSCWVWKLGFFFRWGWLNFALILRTNLGVSFFVLLRRQRLSGLCDFRSCREGRRFAVTYYVVLRRLLQYCTA